MRNPQLSSGPIPEAIQQAKKKTLYDAGLAVRYQVASKEYVDNALSKGSSAFARLLQEIVTQTAWGSVWTRPDISRQQWSLIDLAMLCTLNRPAELAVHVRGAVNNGLSQEEIREVFLQVGMYCGLLAAIEGMQVAQSVLKKEIEETGEDSARIKARL